MAKIISIKDEVVEIGEDGGTLTECRVSDLSFSPRVGDIVDIFRSQNSVRIVLAQNSVQNKGNADFSQSGQGININLSQSIQAPNQGLRQAYEISGQPGKVVVNKTTYLILTFCLGGFGIHKFYVGRVGMGILYLLFIWTFIPFLVAGIEFIIALLQPADANGNIIV